MPEPKQQRLTPLDSKTRERIAQDLARLVVERRILDKERADVAAEFRKRLAALDQQINDAATQLRE